MEGDVEWRRRWQPEVNKASRQAGRQALLGRRAGRGSQGHCARARVPSGCQGHEGPSLPGPVLLQRHFLVAHPPIHPPSTTSLLTSPRVALITMRECVGNNQTADLFEINFCIYENNNRTTNTDIDRKRYINNLNYAKLPGFSLDDNFQSCKF